VTATPHPIVLRSRRFVELWVASFSSHKILTYASAIAFRALVALIPLTLLGFGLLGRFGLEDVWRRTLAPQVQANVTQPVFGAIDFSVEKIFSDASLGLIVFAAVLAILDVSSSVRACMGGMNAIYETDEKRSAPRRFMLSIALGTAIAVALIGAMLVVVTAPKLVDHGAVHLVLVLFRWPVAAAALGLAVGTLVRYAPAEPRPARWVSAGALVVVAVWIGTSVLFRVFVTSVANFKTAAGSLAVFLVLTTYVYVSSIIFLVGVQLDEFARKDAKRGESGILDALRGGLG
jgi:membrane protein